MNLASTLLISIRTTLILLLFIVLGKYTLTTSTHSYHVGTENLRLAFHKNCTLASIIDVTCNEGIVTLFYAMVFQPVM
jgi:hypothetical protein